MTRPPIPIVLTEVEQQIALHVAWERHTRNESAGVENKKYSTEDPVLVHQRGMAGEIAFCKLFNLFPDFTTNPRKGSPDAERFGATVDVKTITRPDGNLLVNPWKSAHGVDHYALIVVTEWPARFAFVGFATHDEVFHPDRLKPLSNGPGYVVKPGDLTADQIFRRRE